MGLAIPGLSLRPSNIDRVHAKSPNTYKLIAKIIEPYFTT